MNQANENVSGSEQGSPILRVENLCKTHYLGETEVHALRGLSCEFAPGSFNFILGPSGSGKSTLLYLLGALDQPTSGEIHFEDQPITSWTDSRKDEYRRNQVGFIFQSFNLLKTLNAVDNVLVPYFPVGVGAVLKQRAVDLLSEVGLSHRLEHRPNHLSGGEQQRVAIARALLKEPKIVLADEPTGELDTQTGAEVFQYLRNLHEKEQTTVIVVTHDQRYLRPGDRLLHLRDGRLEGEEIVGE